MSIVADDDAETNPMSLENVAKEKYGKVKGKLSLSCLTAGTSAEHSQLKAFRLLLRLIRRKMKIAALVRKAANICMLNSAASHAKPFD